MSKAESSKYPPAHAEEESILGDLESIKELLEDEEITSPEPAPAAAQKQPAAANKQPAAAQEQPAAIEVPPLETDPGTASEPLPAVSSGNDESVPLLDDVVDGGLGIDEAPLASPAAHPNDEPDSGGLNDTMFKALMGDDWKASAGLMLREARATIEAHRNDWAPEDTDDLNTALRERIDATLARWLREVVLRHADELRAEILATTQIVINEQLRTVLDEPAGNPAGYKDDDG